MHSDSERNQKYNQKHSKGYEKQVLVTYTAHRDASGQTTGSASVGSRAVPERWGSRTQQRSPLRSKRSSYTIPPRSPLQRKQAPQACSAWYGHPFPQSIRQIYSTTFPRKLQAVRRAFLPTTRNGNHIPAPLLRFFQRPAASARGIIPPGSCWRGRKTCGAVI